MTMMLHMLPIRMNKKILVILAVLTPFLGFGQEQDAQFWSSVGVSKSITDDFKISFAQNLRFRENVSIMDKTFTELGAGYKLPAGFKVSFAYRYNKVNVPEYAGLHTNHRINFDVAYKKSFEQVTLGFRTRYQSKFDHMKDSNADYNRNKFSVKYEATEELEPYVFTDLFIRLNGFNEFNRYRIGFGSSYALSEILELKAFYFLENRITSTPNEQNHIFGLELGIDL